MSRSYKKHPILKDNQGKQLKKDKRRHSRMIRNTEDIPIKARSAHKKILRDAWDIHDYIFRWTEEEARKYYREMAAGVGLHHYNWKEKAIKEFLEKYPTENDYIEKVWAKQIRK